MLVFQRILSGGHVGFRRIAALINMFVSSIMQKTQLQGPEPHKNGRTLRTAEFNKAFCGKVSVTVVLLLAANTTVMAELDVKGWIINGQEWNKDPFHGTVVRQSNGP